MASRENKFLALYKFGHDEFESSCESFGLKRLAYAVIKLTFQDAISVSQAEIGSEPSDEQRLLASLGMLGLTGHRYIAGYEVLGATSREEVFAKIADIKLQSSQNESAFGTFPAEYPPEDFDVSNLPTEILGLSEKDRIVLPSDQEALDILEQIAANKTNHLDLDDIYKSHDEELANHRMQKICPKVWYNDYHVYTKWAYELGTTQALRDFRKAARRLGLDKNRASYVFKWLVLQICDTTVADEQQHKEARKQIDDVFSRRWHNNPNLILVENEAIKQVFDRLNQAGKIAGLSAKAYKLLKEVALGIITEQQTIETMVPINEYLWYVMRLSQADRDSGRYISDAEFVAGCQETTDYSQGNAIFWQVVDHLIDKHGEVANDPIWEAMKKKRKTNEREKSPFTIVVSTQAVADIIDELKVGQHFAGNAAMRELLLELLFTDDDQYKNPKTKTGDGDMEDEAPVL